MDRCRRISEGGGLRPSGTNGPGSQSAEGGGKREGQKEKGRKIKMGVNKPI